jgi:protein gp37
MGASNIEWTQETWNPVSGCTRVSAGCDHCYAVGMTHRAAAMGQTEKYGGLTVLNPKGDRHFNGTVRCHPEALDIPLRGRKPRIWFVNSMSDLFHKDVPLDFIASVFAVMGLASWHTFQVLTKRPERMSELLMDARFQDAVEDASSEFSCLADDTAQATGLVNVHKRLTTDWRAQDHSTLPLENVWLGTSVENQAAANERIPHLLRCPAAVRFLSCEPLLGLVDLTDVCRKMEVGEHHFDALVADVPPEDDGEFEGRCVDWVIAGGESGPGARPCNVEWIRSIVQQCKAASVPVFVKQLGARPHSIPDRMTFRGGGPDIQRGPDGFYRTLVSRKGKDPAEWPADLRVREMPQLPDVHKPASGQQMNGRGEGEQPVDKRGGAR